MKFKIDENLPVEVVAVLHAAGFDAMTVLDQGLRGSSDPVVADICVREDRSLITLDGHFGDVTRYPPSDFPGLIVLRPRQQDKDHVVDLVRRVMPLFDSEPLLGRLWIVEESRVRIRGGSDD